MTARRLTQTQSERLKAIREELSAIAKASGANIVTVTGYGSGGSTEPAVNLNGPDAGGRQRSEYTDGIHYAWWEPVCCGCTSARGQR